MRRCRHVRCGAPAVRAYDLCDIHGDVCEDCDRDRTTCEEWCARNNHPLSGDLGSICHCGAYGWVKGEVG